MNHLHGLSAKEISQELGISDCQVRKWFRGVNAPIKLVPITEDHIMVLPFDQVEKLRQAVSRQGRGKHYREPIGSRLERIESKITEILTHIKKGN